MATQRSEKKKKSSAAKKPVVNLQKKKKLTKPKPRRKEMIKKPLKPPAKPTTHGKDQGMKGEKGPTRKMLLAMREKLLKEFAENRIPKPLAAPSEIGDLVDQAGDERDRELSLLLTGRDKEKLMAINEALEKIEEGTYGVCEECGENIGQGRLKVIPLAKLCVSCQSKMEKDMSIQKKTEEDLTYRGLAYAISMEEEET
jgi:DnaK suppressor protein